MKQLAIIDDDQNFILESLLTEKEFSTRNRRVAIETKCRKFYELKTIVWNFVDQSSVFIDQDGKLTNIKGKAL